MGKKKNDSEGSVMDNDGNCDVWDAPSPGSGTRDNPWPFEEGDNVVGGIKLSWPTAERITIDVLKANLEMIYDRETNHKVFCEYYSDEDREQDRKMKKALKRVLKYFSEEE